MVIDAMQWNPVTWISDGTQFLSEVRAEFRKVTWPPQKEAVAGTIGVVVIVAIITTALFTVDMGLGWILQFVLP